jgi:hypothetical protein
MLHVSGDPFMLCDNKICTFERWPNSLPQEIDGQHGHHRTQTLNIKYKNNSKKSKLYLRVML